MKDLVTDMTHWSTRRMRPESIPSPSWNAFHNATGILVFLLLGFSPVRGLTDNIGDGYGIPGDYLIELAPDARELGRGGGSVSLVDNTASIYLNPAGLGWLEYMEVMAGYTWLFTDFMYYNGAFAYSFGKYGTTGLHFCGFTSPEIPELKEWGYGTGAVYRNYDFTFLLSYGKSFLDRFSAGLNLKLASQRIAQYADIGVGFDFGAQAKALEWLWFGVNVVNLGGPSLTLKLQTETFSPTLRFGTGVRLFQDKVLVNGNVAVLDLYDPNDDYEGDPHHPIRWSAGAEGWPIPYAGLRGGINDRLAGGGFGLRVLQFEADFAMMYHYLEKEHHLPFTYSFSLRYTFGKPVPSLEKSLLEKEQQLNAHDALNKARQLYIQGDFDPAWDLVRTYLEQFPDDSSAQNLYSELKTKIAGTKIEDMLVDARDAMKKRRFDDADTLLAEILEIAPNDTAANRMKEQLLLQRSVEKHLVNVKRYYQNKQYEKMANELYLILQQDSLHEEALAYREKIKDFLVRREADKHYTLASKYYHEDNDLEKAHAELQQALTVAPDHKEANALYNKIGKEIKQLYLKKVGRIADRDGLDVKDGDVKKLLEIDIRDRLIQARKLISEGRLNEARSEVQAVLTDEPSNTEALDLKETILRERNKVEAESNYQQALRLFNESDFEQADSSAARALMLDPDHGEAGKLLEEIRRAERRKNLDAARKVMSSGKPEDLEKAHDMVKQYRAVDKDNEEAQQLEKTIDVELLIVKAKEHIGNGAYDKADSAIQKALAIDPDNAKAQDAFKQLKEVMNLLME